MSTKLDNEERYMVAYLRSAGATRSVHGWLLIKLAGVAIFIFGFINNDRAVIFTGFALLAVIEVYHTILQPRSMRLICSAVAKLETRIEELEAAASESRAKE